MPLGGEAATAKRRNGLFPGAQEGVSTAATPIHELPLTRASRVNPLLAAAPTSGTATSPSPFPEHYDSIGVTFHRHPAPPQPTNPYSALVDSQSFAVLSSFTLENGVTLKNVEVAFKTWGTMKGQGDAADDGVGNVVVVSHALSGSADVADWWSSLLGPGRPLDPANYFIIAFNALGSPYGSASPVTVNPATGRPYGPDFPSTTVRDDVGVQGVVLKALGVTRVRSIVGGSMGGFATLEYPLMFPHLVKSTVPIATSAYHSAWTISWSETQRQAIFADPAYQNGRYPVPKRAGKGHGSEEALGPEAGLKAARMIALMTYRTRESLEGRFGRGRVPLVLPPIAGRKLGLIESENQGVLAAEAPEESWDSEFKSVSDKVGLDQVLHNEGMPSNKLYDLKYEAGYGNRGGGAKTEDPAPASGDRSKSLGGEDDDLAVEESGEEESEEARAVFFAQTYLRHHAAKFVARFDANCYIAVTRKMDSMDVARGRVGWRDPQGKKWSHRERCAAVLASVKCPALVLGVDSDNLYPLVEQQDLAAALPYSDLKVIRSLHGHDGFLIEMSQVGKYIDEFLRKVPELVKLSEAASLLGAREAAVQRPSSRGGGKL